MGRAGFKHAFVFFALLYAAACYQYSYNYKLVSDTLPATRKSPLQEPLAGESGRPACCKGPYCWEFTPLFNYDISAVAFGVSHKFASKLDDVLAADVGLLWGENSAKELYKDVQLRVMMDHYDARWRSGAQFNLNEAANTHIATCDAGAFRAVKAIKAGDQVRLRGWLVSAKISEKPGETDPAKIMTRNSSVSREDQGEGACELLYVPAASDVEILRDGPRLWLWLKWFGLAGLLASAAAIVLAWHRRLKKDMDEADKAAF